MRQLCLFEIRSRRSVQWHTIDCPKTFRSHYRGINWIRTPSRYNSLHWQSRYDNWRWTSVHTSSYTIPCSTLFRFVCCLCLRIIANPFDITEKFRMVKHYNITSTSSTTDETVASLERTHSLQEYVDAYDDPGKKSGNVQGFRNTANVNKYSYIR